MEKGRVPGTLLITAGEPCIRRTVIGKTHGIQAM